MGFSEGFLQGLQATNGIIQSWQDRKDRQAWRDHMLDREQIQDQRYNDEQQYRHNQDQLAAQQWDKTFDLKKNQSDRDYQLSRSRLNLAAQQQAFNQQVQLRAETQAKVSQITAAMQNAATNGDSQAFSAAKNLLQKTDPQNPVLKMLDDPSYTSSIVRSGNTILNAFQDSSDMHDFNSRALNDPKVNSALNDFLGTYLNRSKGQKAPDGSTITGSSFAGFIPVPQDPKNPDSPPSQDRVGIMLKVRTSNGKSYTAPVTANRTSSPLDPVASFDIGNDLLKSAKDMLDGATQMQMLHAQAMQPREKDALNSKDYLNAVDRRIRTIQDASKDYSGQSTISYDDAKQQAIADVNGLLSGRTSALARAAGDPQQSQADDYTGSDTQIKALLKRPKIAAVFKGDPKAPLALRAILENAKATGTDTSDLTDADYVARMTAWLANYKHHQLTKDLPR